MTRTLVAAALAASLGLTVPPAEAGLILSAQIDGGGVITAIDNQVINTCAQPLAGPCQLPDIDPTLGVLTLSSALAAGGDLNIGISVQTQTVGPINRLDSTGTQVTNLSPTQTHSFQVAIGATDFVGPVSTATTTGAGQFSHLGGGYGSSTISMRWFNDPLNVQGAVTPGPGQPGILIDTFAFSPTLNPESFSHTGGPFVVADPGLFAMTLQFAGTLGPQVRLTGREMTEIKPVLIPAATPFTLLAQVVRWLIG